MVKGLLIINGPCKGNFTSPHVLCSLTLCIIPITMESLNIYMQTIKWEGGIFYDNDGEVINWSVMLGFLCGQLENKCGILFVPPFILCRPFISQWKEIDF